MIKKKTGDLFKNTFVKKYTASLVDVIKVQCLIVLCLIRRMYKNTSAFFYKVILVEYYLRRCHFSRMLQWCESVPILRNFTLNDVIL